MNYTLKQYKDNLFPNSSSIQLVFLFFVNFFIITINWLISNTKKLFFIDSYNIHAIWNILATLIIVFLNIKIFNLNLKFRNIFKNNKASLLIFSIMICLVLFIYIIDRDEKKAMYFSDILFYLSAAIYEEIIFRCYLLGIIIVLLKKYKIKNNVWFAILISSFLFLLVHIPYTSLIGKSHFINYLSIFIGSIMFSWLYIKYSNIFLVVFMHFILNLVLLVLPINTNILLLLFLEFFSLFIIIASSNIINFSIKNKYIVYISLLFVLGLFSYIYFNKIGDKYRKIEYKNEYSILIPENLLETDELNDLTTFQYENKSEDFYIIILEQPKQIFYNAIDIGKFEVSKNIEGYQKVVENHFKYETNLKDFKLFDVSKINSKITFSMTGIDIEDNYPVFYRYSIVESKTKFYQIMSWTNINNSRKTITKMNKIIDSFKLLEE